MVAALADAEGLAAHNERGGGAACEHGDCRGERSKCKRRVAAPGSETRKRAKKAVDSHTAGGEGDGAVCGAGRGTRGKTAAGFQREHDGLFAGGAAALRGITREQLALYPEYEASVAAAGAAFRRAARRKCC